MASTADADTALKPSSHVVRNLMKCFIHYMCRCAISLCRALVCVGVPLVCVGVPLVCV